MPMSSAGFPTWVAPLPPADATVSSVTILKSTGHILLDQAAIHAASAVALQVKRSAGGKGSDELYHERSYVLSATARPDQALQPTAEEE
jgi:hypothetical protein